MTLKTILAVSFAVLGAVPARAQAPFEVVHAFAGSREPAQPGNLLLAADGNFYGLSDAGGRFNLGSIFRMTANGSIAVLHDFSGSDGAVPVLLIEGPDGDFYGATRYQEGVDGGTIFSMTSNGDFAVLHTFAVATSPPDKDGWGPGALVFSADGNLYGTTGSGGTQGNGTFFRMTPAGALTTLHAFAGGAEPSGAGALLQASDGNFYGTSWFGGGTPYGGTVFRVTPTGVVTVLHSFSDPHEGAGPLGLIQGSDGSLYGTAGLVYGYTGGTVFKITLTGVFTILRSFDGNVYGNFPQIFFQADGGEFYGKVSFIASDFGTIFSMTPDGTVTTLHTFDGGLGGTGVSALVQGSDGNFYGTSGGGIADLGLSFRLTPAGIFDVLHSFVAGPEGAFPEAALIQGTDGNFYGTTSRGGTFNQGTIFRTTPAGATTILHAFSGATDGAYPWAPLVQATDGYFYGTTYYGVFRIAADGTFTPLYAFGPDDGQGAGGLIQASDGNLYGTCCWSGPGRGMVFRLTLAGVFSVVHSFSAVDGFGPSPELLQARDGNFYGTGGEGIDASGQFFLGAVFRLTPAGQLMVLHRFVFDEGIGPHGLIQATDGNFYLTTTCGKSPGVFRVTPAGIVAQIAGVGLWCGSEIDDPVITVIQGRDGNLYGTSSSGFNQGAIFKVTLDGVITTLHTFTTANAGWFPQAALVQAKNGDLYGTAFGGAFNSGVVFRLTPPMVDLPPPRADFNRDGRPDLLWQNDVTRQSTVWDLAGAQGNLLQSWNWLTSTGISGWTIAATADFDGDGWADLVWQNETTRQVTVWYMGGANGNELREWTWLSASGVAGWRVVGVADFNGDGHPDLVWQHDTSRRVTVWYFGGTHGSTLLGWNWLATVDLLGWRVVAVADLNGGGKPDLVWQHDATRQVTVWYLGGAQGATFLEWRWLSASGVPGWTVVGANDFNGDGTPDLVWQNDATRQVTVWFMGGSQGTDLLGWDWIAQIGIAGWRAIAR